MTNVRWAMVLVTACTATLGARQASQSRGKPPAPVQRPASGSRPLSAADEIRTFVLPTGYHAELIAAEPLVQDPIAIDWDPDGRLWVIEWPNQIGAVTPSTDGRGTGRIVVLEDTDGDGRMDKRTVFADGLGQPRALKVLDHGVLVGDPPNVWLMRDRDGDLKVDSKDLVTDTYGRRDASMTQNANGLTWALDNWIHTSNAGVYLRLKNGKFEIAKTLPRGQWGLSQDDAGRLYRNSDESALHVDVVPTPYFTRNANLLRTRGSYESLDDSDDLNEIWPAHPTRGVNHGDRAGVLRADASLAAFTSASAPLVYRGDRLPADVEGNVFVAEPAANLVSRIIVDDTGESLVGRKADEKHEFLVSTDERFRPVYLATAPDGTLSVVDLYRGVIQPREDMTPYLRNQVLSRQLDDPPGHGRIFRVTHDGMPAGPRPSLSNASAATLVQTLSNPNGWWRDTAQRLLVEHGDLSVVPALASLAETAPEPRTRLHALWTLDGLDKIDVASVVRALDDPSSDVRASALRLAERWLGDPKPTLQTAVMGRIDDQSWVVRAQLAATLGTLPFGVRESALRDLLERHGDDPVVADAALSGLGSRELVLWTQWLPSAEPTPTTETVMALLAATIIHGAQDADAGVILQTIGDGSRPPWLRVALMQGAEAALLGIPLPLPGSRDAADGRGQSSATTNHAAAMPALRLQSAPAALVDLGRQSGDLGARAKKLLTKIEWPGKAVAAAPLSR